MENKFNMSDEAKAIHDMWSAHIKKFLWGDVNLSDIKYKSNRIVTAISINPENNNKHKILDFNELCNI